MEAHVSEFPVGTYKKAHRHSGGAHIIILSGQGYSLMWKQGGSPIRTDWKTGSLFSPPEAWFHQHFNTGKEPTRYLALKAVAELESRKFKGIMKQYQIHKSVKLGGDQIEYEDEDPEIRRLYKEELAKTGVEWRMSKFFPGE
jgi:gentisate 1,2-dioxygenase